MAGERRTWMMFVDGENFTIRAQELVKVGGFKLTEGRWYRRDTFVWMPDLPPVRSLNYKSYLADPGLRAYYYTSLKADTPTIEAVRSELWEIGFTPSVFKKVRPDEKAKGVDISLTKDMLSHAFLNHYEVAVLVAGDGDYVPLVEEVKRQGKLVVCAFFKDHGLNDGLRLVCDEYHDLQSFFMSSWMNKKSE